MYEKIIIFLQIFRKEQEIEALKKKMATTALSESEMKIIQKGLNELEKEANHAKEKMKEVIKEEQDMPLNVDTISKVHIPTIKQNFSFYKATIVESIRGNTGNNFNATCKFTPFFLGHIVCVFEF